MEKFLIYLNWLFQINAKVHAIYVLTGRLGVCLNVTTLSG